MAKNKKYEDSHFEEYFDTQTIVDIDIEQRMREAFIDYRNLYHREIRWEIESRVHIWCNPIYGSAKYNIVATAIL